MILHNNVSNSMSTYCKVIQMLFLYCFPIFQVNRIKTPRQLDEFVEMESESGNPVSKAFFRIKAEVRGVNICLFI